MNTIYLAMTWAEEVREINSGFVEFLITIVEWETPVRQPLPDSNSLEIDTG